MLEGDANIVQYHVETEGFDYAFRHYTDFSEIKDEKFHELRMAYINAAKALIDYAGLEV